jgi:phytoene synthase
MEAAGGSDREKAGAVSDPVLTTARAFEHDRYLAALLAPVDRRPALLALAAFAGEVARIPSFVSEPMVGAIRLQWWRDAVAALATEPTPHGHPILEAVALAARKWALPLAPLLEIIDAHQDRLAEAPIADDAGLAHHLAQTEGAMTALGLAVLAGPAGLDAFGPLVASTGRALGLARLIVELPQATAEGRTLIPERRLADAGIPRARLLAGEPGSAIDQVVNDLVAEARRELSAARAAARAVPRRARPALLPLALVEPYLRACERPGRDPVRDVAELVPLSRVARLALAALTGRM